MNELDGKTDADLIEAYRNGCENAMDYLINKYKQLVILKARAYFIAGADREDVIQEGMIGLFKAVRDYDADKGCPFGVFAGICVERQMITAIRTTARQKHMPLNTSLPLNAADDFESRNSNPEDRLIGAEDFKKTEDFIAMSLSDLENKILSLYLHGKNYSQIANLIGKNEKSVDNALQRVRQKIEKRKWQYEKN